MSSWPPPSPPPPERSRRATVWVWVGATAALATVIAVATVVLIGGGDRSASSRPPTTTAEPTGPCQRDSARQSGDITEMCVDGRWVRREGPSLKERWEQFRDLPTTTQPPRPPEPPWDGGVDDGVLDDAELWVVGEVLGEDPGARSEILAQVRALDPSAHALVEELASAVCDDVRRSERLTWDEVYADALEAAKAVNPHESIPTSWIVVEAATWMCQREMTAAGLTLVLGEP